jgi:hypothetical protein
MRPAVECDARELCRPRRLGRPSHVLRVRDGLKVIGVSAGTDTAKVVQLQSGRDRTVALLPGNDVGVVAVTASAQLPVARRGDVSLPNVARGLVAPVFDDVPGSNHRSAMPRYEGARETLDLAFVWTTARRYRGRFAATTQTQAGVVGDDLPQGQFDPFARPPLVIASQAHPCLTVAQGTTTGGADTDSLFGHRNCLLPRDEEGAVPGLMTVSARRFAAVNYTRSAVTE